MSHHLADAFYRHAVVQANQGCEGVTALIVGKVAVQTTLFGKHVQAAVEVSGDWHINQFAVLAVPAILLNDAQGYAHREREPCIGTYEHRHNPNLRKCAQNGRLINTSLARS